MDAIASTVGLWKAQNKKKTKIKLLFGHNYYLCEFHLFAPFRPLHVDYS